MAKAKKPAAPARAKGPAGARKTSAANAKAATKPKKKKPSVTIGVTPPELAPGTAAARFDDSVKTPATRPTPTELAKAPWLTQDRAYRVGYYLLTHGLTEHGHEELELCNVPGSMLESASELLLHIAAYVIDDGGKLEHGEVMLVDESPLSVIGFLRVKQGRAGTDHESDVLRVVFLR